MLLVKRSFGFSPIESLHHFVVYIPRGATQEVRISEHLTWTEADGSSRVHAGSGLDGQLRVSLARHKWDGIADALRSEFNRRLRGQGLGSGSWRMEENLVRLDLGKELVLLAWAVEDADPGLIPQALANWLGLYPEERWWLFTQTAAASGHASTGRNVGWRKAVRYALTENPVSDMERDALGLPEFYRRAEAGAQPRLLDARNIVPDGGHDAGDSNDSTEVRE